MKRLIALVLAYFFLGLAVAGVFLPLLPTVPFLLLSAWFASKGSERLHRWLYAHPVLGKMLTDWERHGAISRASKVTAVIMMIASWLMLYFVSGRVTLLIGLAVLFSVVITFIVTRPEPEK